MVSEKSPGNIEVGDSGIVTKYNSKRSKKLNYGWVILGLIFVRWVGKDSRRIEINNIKTETDENKI